MPAALASCQTVDFLTMNKRRYTLTIACPDRVGIVAAVSTFIASNHGWIVEASHHADPVDKWFFMRQEILAESLKFECDAFRQKFEPIAREYAMRWKISDSANKNRV